MPVMRRMGVGRARLRVVAQEPHGAGLVSEYPFNHKRSR